MTVQKWLIEVFKIEKKWVIREKKYFINSFSVYWLKFGF